MAPSSMWERLTWHKNNMLSLPVLESIALPRPELMRSVLAESVVWLIGPPKIGKTLIAHYLAYVHALGKVTADMADLILTFEGTGDSAIGVDFIMEASLGPTAVVIFDNPLGVTEARDAGTFVTQLSRLRTARRDLNIILTSRTAPYFAVRTELNDRNLGASTPATFGEWYDPDALLLRYAPEVRDLDHDLVVQLGCPALIAEYRDHGVLPGSKRERAAARRRYGSASDDITLDKLNVLESREILAAAAMVLRLQEYAFSLPSSEDIASLLDVPLTAIGDLGLVASRFQFDGEERLQFEHATTREAAELLLTAEIDAGLPRLAGLIASGRSPWLQHSLDLWRAERAAATASWTSLRALDEVLIAAVAPQILAVSQGASEAIDLVSGLEIDAWTAQDIAYELAANWSHYSAYHAAQELANQLAEDRHASGAYALLEAVLYVRGNEVAELWGLVDRAFATLQSQSAPWNRELLLAVDALAWRFAPEWHRETGWVSRFLNELAVEDDGWALVRFLRGYHPDGLQSLADWSDSLAAAVRRDGNHQWTKGQGEVGLWLLQWHFVHQCRARAQLAHQPWVTQEYLCRSFHPAVVRSDRDQSTAELIRAVSSVRQRDSGWGFFLAENVRAIDAASFGQLSFDEARDSLMTALPGDTGVLSAVLTYAPEELYPDLVRRHFESEEARSHLFGALVDGLVVDGVRLLEPRFAYRRSLANIYRACGIDWPSLKRALPSGDVFDEQRRFNVERVIRQMEHAARDHPFVNDARQRALVDEVLRRVKGGDFRLLEGVEHRSVHRRASEKPDSYTLLLESAVVRLVDEPPSA